MFENQVKKMLLFYGMSFLIAKLPFLKYKPHQYSSNRLIKCCDEGFAVIHKFDTVTNGPSPNCSNYFGHSVSMKSFLVKRR